MERAVRIERPGILGSRSNLSMLNYGFYILLALAIAGFLY